MCEVLSKSEQVIDYMNILDIAFKAATVCIAGFNVFFAVKIFRLKDKKDETEKERDRKIQLLKTLVLDHNLKNYHSIFDDIETQLVLLQQPNLTNDNKQIIDTSIADLFIQLRGKFYDSLLAIDDSLYESIKGKADALQTHFTETIFDPGINLTHMPKFDELISQKMTTTKTEIIKKLFNYRG
jgi:hypothetical protein